MDGWIKGWREGGVGGGEERVCVRWAGETMPDIAQTHAMRAKKRDCADTHSNRFVVRDHRLIIVLRLYF